MEQVFKPKKNVKVGDYKYHLVLSFEDNGDTFFVVKYYGRYKQWWHYEVWDEWTMDYNKKRGYRIVKHRKKKNED